MSKLADVCKDLDPQSPPSCQAAQDSLKIEIGHIRILGVTSSSSLTLAFGLSCSSTLVTPHEPTVFVLHGVFACILGVKDGPEVWIGRKTAGKYSTYTTHHTRTVAGTQTATFMAKPLFIAEILRVIIAELAADDKQSLARLAQTSKIFADPCLDGLWHTMGSFIPFIPLLPRSRLKTLSRPGVRIQRTGEWESFDKYARRVRVYRQTDDVSYPKAYQVASCMREKHLFPNLRDLGWRNTGGCSLESWSLPSSLRSLTIFENPMVGIELFLHQVAHDAPELETLQINCSFPVGSAPCSTVAPLPFNRLEYVTLIFPDLARIDICHTLSLAPITDLAVMLSSSKRMWQPGSLFHGLERLTIFGDPALASLFVKCVGSTRLRTMYLVLLGEDATLSHCQELLAVLFKTHGQSLQCLYLNIDGESLSLEDPSVIDQLMNKFLSELRLRVHGSGVERVHVVLQGLPDHIVQGGSVVVTQFINAAWTQRALLQIPLFRDAKASAYNLDYFHLPNKLNY
ncbi:hypothetical protein DFJ58DRAFT_911026 [Suillus subalutaceus]|uniref:uncharacterized protein n=1 Tax=Suillus subalutaceus TaxID=48586 RepID=UPI001B87C4AA|nr:uncharacterized protein DFJ58DRAFT_911026 [Suillus subalutaceus]KAG1870680.1 hypothetical protein DFJ58DRAFT_911026 [Suillus subalutaceus]